MFGKNLHLALFFSTGCLIGCYENIEGCLDADASNFEIDADIDCCCEYPQLVLQWNQVMDSVNYNRSSWYRVGDISLQIPVVKLFFSDIRLTDSVGSTFQISDSLVLEGTYVKDDVTRLDSDEFSSAVGTFIPSGSYKNIESVVGLSTLWQQADPAEFDSGHDLDTSAAPYDGNIGYPDWYIEMNTAFAEDTMSFTFFDQLENVRLSAQISDSKEKGENFNLVFRIDYALWFSQVDFQVDSEEEIVSKISNQILSSISVL